ncbi:MAG: hypothetical protein CL874_04755 [Dehalococcoidales bacterium]|jgi:hypothetical protein|nr:hypothetical protein [Dehalococcoidales bacterium]MDP6448656.1 hypothetical protein [Dehalococcoidales bacterium]MDP6577262.1 hypothetical protein [Dehalococcoidales bacterium]|tara:strand:- start:288 stop:578 length:291 start_codon:yes stop_codon:yes gene_type:complete
MGANVAFNFAFQYYEECLALILVGIGSSSSYQSWWREWWSRLADLAEQKGIVVYLEEMKKLLTQGIAFTDSKTGKQASEETLNSSPKRIAYTIRGV